MPVNLSTIARYVAENRDRPSMDLGRDTPFTAPGQGPLRLWKLLADLQARSYANCEPWGWDATHDNGDGTYGAYQRLWSSVEDGAGTTLKMVDTTGTHWGLSGEYLWGRILGRGTPDEVIIEARGCGSNTHQGKLDGALSAAGSATFSIYSCATGTWTDTTVNVTVYAPPRLLSGSIGTGNWGRIYYELTRPGWEYDSGPCP